MKDTILKGRVWAIRDESGNRIDDIDTDMIFHNKYLHITDINEMGQYAFDNLKGWEDFSKKAKKGDILFVGRNFGSGSSRQQAVDCFIALGVQAIVGESFGAIYKRNVINSGFPLIIVENILGKDENGEYYVESGDEIEIDLEKGIIKNLTKNKEIKAKPFSKVQMDIYQAGDLFTYGKKM